ncbi:MAG TPA: hypothetical protein DD727_07970 [Clostridiales bacterium]|nr:hypothetical protein [Clostridiales bacterium]
MQKVGLAVIGGGPAGMAAAIAAHEAGVRDILILEREDHLGGILPQCIHTGFGLHLLARDLTGPEYASRDIDRINALGIRYRTGTMVLRLSADRVVTAMNPRDGLITLKAGGVVLAMGCRERTRGALAIPGTRPAGIFTAGTAQKYMNMEGYLPGREVVILGSGDIGLIMARRLTLEGARVKMVLEILPRPGGLARNIVQCLQDFHIPLKLNHTVVRIHGRQRLEGVTTAQVDNNKNPLPGTEQFVPCDTLLLSVGLIPENELSRTAGIQLDPTTGGPLVDNVMQTSIPGIFACGNVVHVHDLVDHVTLEAIRAGKGAAAFLQDGTPAAQTLPQFRPRSSPSGGDRTLTAEAAEALFAAPADVADTAGAAAGAAAGAGAGAADAGAGAAAGAADADADAGAGHNILCIVCPTGCIIRVISGQDGSILSMSGHRCKRGWDYARAECTCPVRTLTTVIRIEGGTRPMAPVRTRNPVPRAMLPECMAKINRMKLKAPVKTGDVVIRDLLGTGADVVVTGTVNTAVAETQQ